MGLDLSLSSSAYYISDSGDHGVVKSKDKGVKRLLFIRDTLLRVVKGYNPDLICIEDYSYGSSVGQAFSIGELGGIIKCSLIELDFKVLLMSPSSLKKFISGKGNSSKDVMMLKTFQKYGEEFTDNNICDAFGLVQVGKAYLEGTDIKYEKEVLEKVEVCR